MASCALSHYSTRVYSMVIFMVMTRYIDTQFYTCVARYLLAGTGMFASRSTPRNPVKLGSEAKAGMYKYILGTYS